jgi:hypothetical protein
VADLTVLIARSRDGNFEAMVSPTGQITPFTFDLACRALEFVEMYPIKEKQA